MYNKIFAAIISILILTTSSSLMTSEVSATLESPLLVEQNSNNFEIKSSKSFSINVSDGISATSERLNKINPLTHNSNSIKVIESKNIKLNLHDSILSTTDKSKFDEKVFQTKVLSDKKAILERIFDRTPSFENSKSSQKNLSLKSLVDENESEQNLWNILTPIIFVDEKILGTIFEENSNSEILIHEFTEQNEIFDFEQQTYLLVMLFAPLSGYVLLRSENK